MTPLANLIKYYRDRAGLTQEQVGPLAGIDPSYLCRIENGTRVPTRDKLIAIGTALGLDPRETDRMLMIADYRPQDPASMLFEPQLAELDDVIYMAGPHSRDELRTLINVALERGRSLIQKELAAA